MKKLIIGTSIVATLGLVGCGSDDSLEEIREQTETERPLARIVFDPTNSNLNIPNDLLMIPAGSFFDFTIETEGTPFDSTDPEQAIGALDGWSTQHPFVINVDLPAGVDIDPATVAPGAIRIFEATQALEGDTPTCIGIAAQAAAPGLPCELGEELVFGQDFVATYAGDGSGTIQVVPLTLFKPAQGHMLVVTEELRDNQSPSRPVRGSTTWDLARQDQATFPLGTESQLQLQSIVNLLVGVLEPTGLTTTDVSYAAYFTTQSAGTVLSTVKQLQIAPFAQAFSVAFADALAAGADELTAQQTATQFAGQFLPPIITSAPESGSNAYEELVGRPEFADNPLAAFGTCDTYFAALTDPQSPLFTAAQEAITFVAPACAASRVTATVDLPYYLSTTQPQTEWWRAACTNGAMLQLLGEEQITSILSIPDGAGVGANNALCQALSTPLFDLNLNTIGLNDERHLTRYSPVPAAQGRNQDNANTFYNETGTETLNVQFTVPDVDTLTFLSTVTGGAIAVPEMPAEGWPVVIFQHGLSGSKENALLVAGALTLAGYATVAIDQPLHGERALVDAEGNLVSASLDPTNFLNLTSLLTGRDNTRQASSDTLALRLALHALVDTTGTVNIDPMDVNFLGQSLGTVTGISSVANANTSLGGELAAFDSLYKINAAVINVPASGISLSVLESPAFSGLIQSTVAASVSEDFVAFLGQFAAENGLSVEAALAPAFAAYIEVATAEDLALIDAGVSSFAFAAQTVVDSSDPINYAQRLGANTPTLVQLVVGGGQNDDGSTALTDQVNPVTTSLPLYGSGPFAQLAGLPTVTSTTEGSGVVNFISGSHSSLLSTSPSVAATVEMQNQAVAFFSTGNIVITDTAVVAN